MDRSTRTIRVLSYLLMMLALFGASSAALGAGKPPKPPPRPTIHDFVRPDPKPWKPGLSAPEIGRTFEITPRPQPPVINPPGRVDVARDIALVSADKQLLKKYFTEAQLAKFARQVGLIGDIWENILDRHRLSAIMALQPDLQLAIPFELYSLDAKGYERLYRSVAGRPGSRRDYGKHLQELLAARVDDQASFVGSAVAGANGDLIERALRGDEAARQDSALPIIDNWSLQGDKLTVVVKVHNIQMKKTYDWPVFRDWARSGGVGVAPYYALQMVGPDDSDDVF